MLTVIQCVRNARWRERQSLQAELQRQGCSPIIVEAAEFEPCRGTFVRALRQGTDGYIVRLEDDAWPAPDFATKTEGLLARGSFDVLMLYSNRRRVGDAYAEGRDLVRLPSSELSMSVGIAVATGIVPAFAAWLPSWEAANPQHLAGQDLALAAFCRRERLIVQAAVPSLVQHRDADSYLGHPVGRRRSRTYAAAYGDIPPC